jgi:hypothetical protein
MQGVSASDLQSYIESGPAALDRVSIVPNSADIDERRLRRDRRPAAGDATLNGNRGTPSIPKGRESATTARKVALKLQ